MAKMRGFFKVGFWVLAVIVVLGGIGWFTGSGGISSGGAPAALSSVPLSSAPASGVGTESNPLVTEQVGCNAVQATPDYIGTDRLESGTTVRVTGRAAVYTNGDYSTFTTGAATTLSPCTKYAFLLQNNTDNHNVLLENCQVPDTGSFQLSKGVCGYEGNFENATITLSWYNTDNNPAGNATAQAIPTSPPTTNQTTTAGSSHNLKLKFDGEDRASTQDMTCFLEGNNRTALDKLILSGSGITDAADSSLPRDYTLMGTDSVIWAYDVPAIEGANAIERTVTVDQAAGMRFGSTINQYVRVDCRTKEHFIDTDGSVQYKIKNSDSTGVSMARYTAMMGFQ